MSEQQTYPKSSVGWTGIGLLSVLYTFSFLDRNILNLLVDPVSEALQIGDIEMSILMGGAFAIFYGILGIPLARIADASNRRNLVVAGALLWGVSTVLCGFSNTFMMLVLCRIGLAIGEAALSPTAYSLVADWFEPKKRAFPATVYTWGGMFGNRVGMALLGLLVLVIVEREALKHVPGLEGFQSWQLMFFVVAAPTLVLTLVFALFVREPKRVIGASEAKESPKMREIWRHLQQNPALYAGIILGCGVTNIGYVAAGIWAPQILKRSYGWAISDAAIALGVLSAFTSIIGALALPKLSDFVRDHFKRPDLPIVMSIIFCISGCACGVTAMLWPDAVGFLVFEGAANALTQGGAILAITSLPIIAPPRMRAVLAASFMLINSALATTIAPTLSAVFSEYLFSAQGPRGLALGSAVVCAIVPFVAVPLLAISRKAYGEALRAHLWEEPQGPAGRPA